MSTLNIFDSKEMILLFERKDSINIMHISDIHCGIDGRKSPRYRRERRDSIDAFYRDLKNIPKDWKPDIIAITGDIGWTGKSTDYKEFEHFLTELLKKTELNPENVICCPGNHDKFLPIDQEFPNSINGFSNYYSVDNVWNNIEPLSSNFTNYSKELKKMGIKPLCNNSSLADTKYLYGYQVINGLCFIVLNSAWLCDWRENKNRLDADRCNLLIDANIVLEIFENNIPEIPVIVMFHHPIDWLKQEEIYNPFNTPTTIDYINEKANIILNGHTHQPQNEHNRERLHYIAGTLNSDDTYNSECFLLKIFINEDDIKLSSVLEGRYFAEWNNRQIFWRFEENSTPQYFDMQAAIDYLEKVKNSKSKITFSSLEFLENSKDENGTYKQLYNYINNQKQNFIKKNEEYEKIKQKISLLEKQPQKNENTTEQIVQLKEESINILEEIIVSQELRFKEIQDLIRNIWNSILNSSLSEIEKNEQIKRLIKKDPFGGEIIKDSDDDRR